MTAKRQIAHDAALGRFLQADTLVPEPGSPQGFNRYAYVNNNPLGYVDADGRQARKPLATDTAWSYILREMRLNAGPIVVANIRTCNILGVLNVFGPAMPGGGISFKVSAYKTWYCKVTYGGDWDHKDVIPIAR